MENHGPTDERPAEVLRRLNEFYVSASLGDYFRGRAHGWLSLHAGIEVELPEKLVERLGHAGAGARILPSKSTPDQLALDAFAMAYHASETYCRQLLAVLHGAGPRTSPALALKSTPTGRSFSQALAQVIGTNEQLDSVVDFAFLPHEVREGMSDDEVDGHRSFLRQWTRHHVRRLESWKNPYNAFKHGLAATAPPTQIAFIPEPLDETATAHALMDGPVLHTLEYEVMKRDGSKVEKLSWWHRALDPIELIADVLTTAEILDWLKAIARGRLLQTPVAVPLKSAPLPLALRKPGPPGISFRMDVGATTVALGKDEMERMDALLNGQEVTPRDESAHPEN
ncbi:hypothetical protein ACPPVT_17645 [Angustibacter sp. McL0619]|uniref:hypothetical protein n=1 Tax=Angustibacter sp. McL0619 TaxID=3415676 RepID=UPI003CF9166B